MVNEDQATLAELMEEKLARQCVEYFTTFFRTYPPSPEYKYGIHTLQVLERLDRAVKDFERGISTDLILTMPFRHGKSDIVSRRLPVWALGRNPTMEIILACYADELAQDLSRKARQCMRETGWMFGVSVSQESAAVGHWEVFRGEDGDDQDLGFVKSNRKYGNMSATGIGGSIVGRGAHGLLIDDYLKNREEAESQRVRDKRWDSFNEDLRTRLAPVHFTVVCANRWHEDDIVGRILTRQDTEHKNYDPEAPVFEELRFPMQNEAGDWLFRQRFSRKWYVEQRSTLGTYGWNSLAQQNPQPRQGKLLRADLVEYLSGEEFDKMAEGARWARGWDVASSEKQLNKSDPDESVGTKATYYRGNILVDNVISGQWTGAKRDALIAKTAEVDGQRVVVNLEAVAHGGKDMVEHITRLLAGKAIVRPYHPTVDKVARATPYEAYFELKKVYARKAAWNKAWEQQFCAFPNGAHDDKVDSFVVALNELIRMSDGIGISI